MARGHQVMLREDGSKQLLVHFTFLSPAGTTKVEGMSLGGSGPPTHKIACVPNLVQLSSHMKRSMPWHRTDDPRAVTCPMCEGTQEYKDAMNALRFQQ